MKYNKPQNSLKIGIFGAVLTLIGDMLIGAVSIIQFIAFVSGRTPFPKWYCVFNLVIGTILINSLRRLGNTALINGIGTSNKSIGAIVMFTAFLIGWEKYAGKRQEVKGITKSSVCAKEDAIR